MSTLPIHPRNSRHRVPLGKEVLSTRAFTAYKRENERGPAVCGARLVVRIAWLTKPETATSNSSRRWPIS